MLIPTPYNVLLESCYVFKQFIEPFQKWKVEIEGQKGEVILLTCFQN